MPQLMFMPSRAGPAAQEQVTSSPASASTISPLVPMSMKSVRPEAGASRSQATTPDTMSPPT